MTHTSISQASTTLPAAASGKRARHFCASVLLTVFSLQGLVGCGNTAGEEGDGPADSAESSAPSSAAPQLNISTEVDGTHFSASLVEQEGALVGTRTVTYADGRTETEDVYVPMAGTAVSNALDQIEQTPLGAGLHIASSERTANGTNYVLASDSGLALHLATEGDVEYVILELAAAVLITAIAVCGATAIASIISCAARDRCWSYNSSLFDAASVCSGSCKKC